MPNALRCRGARRLSRHGAAAPSVVRGTTLPPALRQTLAAAPQQCRFLQFRFKRARIRSLISVRRDRAVCTRVALRRIKPQESETDGRDSR